MTFSRSRAFAVIGQSYGQFGYDRTSAYGFFQEAIRRVIATDAAAIQTHIGGAPTIADGQTFQRRNYAEDGSAVLKKHVGSIADRYWLETDGTTAGPRLAAAITGINALSQKPSVFIYSHGEQDALSTTTTVLSEEVTDGMLEIFSQLRTAAGSSSLPVFVDVLGPRFSANEFNEYRLRDAMIDMIDAQANVFRGAEKYALQLDSTTHPSPDAGYPLMGAHTGRKVAAWLPDDPELRGPSIASAVKTDTEIAVTITVPAGKTLVKPSTPDFFGLFDGSEDRVAITGYAWAGNVLTLTAENANAAKLRYPARPTSGRGLINLNNIIRLSNPSSADRLYVGEPGLVLESAKTVTL